MIGVHSPAICPACPAHPARSLDRSHDRPHDRFRGLGRAAYALLSVAVLVPAAGLADPARAADDANAAPVSEHTVTGNLGVVSDYRYRGISQTDGKPALQGGFDYAHSSGLYAGFWASNVSWLSDAGGGAVSNSLESDFYGGYKGKAGVIDYDVGLLQYYYPGRYPGAGYTKPHTTEIYAAATYSVFTLKYSHALTNLFGIQDSKNAGYLDGEAKFDVGSGFVLAAHVGYQRVPSGPGRSTSDCSYVDYRLGVSKTVYGFDLGARLIGTNAKGDVGECYRNAYNRDLGRTTVVLAVGKTF